MPKSLRWKCRPSISNAPQCKRSSAESSNHHLPLRPRSRRRDEASGNLYPLWDTTAFLALHVYDIGVASTPAADTVLLLCVPFRPVLVFLSPSAPLFLQRWCAEGGIFAWIISRPIIWRPWHLPGWRIGGTVLDSGMSVANVAEVVDLIGRKQGTSGERMNGRVTPL